MMSVSIQRAAEMGTKHVSLLYVKHANFLHAVIIQVSLLTSLEPRYYILISSHNHYIYKFKDFISGMILILQIIFFLILLPEGPPPAFDEQRKRKRRAISAPQEDLAQVLVLSIRSESKTFR